MENGISGGPGGFCVSDKASTTLESHVRLGFKLQSTESFPLSLMGHHLHHQHHDHHRPLSSSSRTVAGGLTSNSGANEEVGSRARSDIYQDAAAAANGGAVVRTLQSFDISTTTSTGTVSRSPAGGGAMAAALGFPFTLAQWKELERQAMIYKYMMAAVPVPPDLLLPITPTLSTTHSATSHSSLGIGSILNLSLRFSNNKDAEPGRCKRTDGKKWRCSRDVAPHQKYCERHVHRGRPRSRKPVEVQTPFNSNSSSNMINKKTRLIHHHTLLPPVPTSHTSISSAQVPGSTIQPNETPLFIDKPDENISSNSSYKEPNRGLDWAMEREIQQWQHLLQTNGGLTTEGSICHTSAPVFQQDCIEEPLNRIPYADFGECSLFLRPDLVCLEKQPRMETPRGFIDAWSNEDPNTNNSNDKNESSVSSHGNLSPSSLTLSTAMAADNALDEEMGQIQMVLGVLDSDHHKPQVLSWLNPVSWVGSTSTPGGPLAEVLQPSSIAAVSPNPTSPFACNGDSTSTPATRASSPSGVLQRTMLSLSDSSGCANPTINAASTATPEIMPFQWLLS